MYILYVHCKLYTLYREFWMLFWPEGFFFGLKSFAQSKTKHKIRTKRTVHRNFVCAYDGNGIGFLTFLLSPAPLSALSPPFLFLLPSPTVSLSLIIWLVLECRLRDINSISYPVSTVCVHGAFAKWCWQLVDWEPSYLITYLSVSQLHWNFSDARFIRMQKLNLIFLPFMYISVFCIAFYFIFCAMLLSAYRLLESLFRS